MEIFVRDVRGCAKADLSFASICLVGGRNQAGKSSLAEAVRAALTGEALPLDGSGERLTKKESAPRLVRDGAEKGQAIVRSESGAASMSWPKCAYETEGAQPPAASRIAAGLDSLVRMKVDERARFLTDLLKASPSREELLAAIEAAEIAPADKVIAAAWEVIERDGWDHALKVVKEKGAALKGQWREAAGENWGADKAAGWAPTGWSPKWDALTTEDAAAGTAKIEAELKAFDEQQGAVIADRGELEARAAGLPQLEAMALPDLNAYGEALIAAEKAREALPARADDAEEVHPCPHCAEPLAVAPGQSPPWRKPRADKPSEAEVKKIAAAIKAADETLLAAKKAMWEANRMVADHSAALERAREAKKKLSDKPAADLKTRIAIIDRLARAREVAGMIARRTRAAELHRHITGNARLADILAPDGLRQTRLAEKLAMFNEALAILSDRMGAPRLFLFEDMSVGQARGERETALPYWLMSASQQFRCRIILQAAIAQLDGSAMLVIDNDVDQDRAWLRGTIKMLAALGLPALVTMRADTPEEMPPAPPPESGISIARYWIEPGGVVVPVEDVMQKEAAE